jgi:hypothetical protein
MDDLNHAFGPFLARWFAFEKPVRDLTEPAAWVRTANGVMDRHGQPDR